MSAEHGFGHWQNGHGQNFFTPPPSGGAWSPPQPGPPYAQPGHAPQHGVPMPAHSSAPPQQMQNMNMLAMMTMMQQMHPGFPQNMPPPFMQPPPPQSPAVDVQKPMVPPTGSLDEDRLAHTIYEQTTYNGLTYKAAIETLHFVCHLSSPSPRLLNLALQHNGIPAHAWKDFYLERKEKIDDMVKKLSLANDVVARVVKLEGQPSAPSSGSHTSKPTAVREALPSSSRPNVEKGKARSASVSVPRVKVDEKRRPRMAQQTDDASPRSTARRKTVNSLSAMPGSQFLALVPPEIPIDGETGLPAAPSRCPSPPTEIIPAGGGRNAYTDEDAIFFYKLVAWELANNEDATKTSVAELLAQKV